MRLQLDPLADGDAQTLERDIRASDAAELQAAGLTAVAALRGIKGWALRDSDTLLAVFGVQPFDDSSAIGVPWLLCTDHLRQRMTRRQTLMYCHNFVAASRLRFWRLQNIVHRHNAQAIHLIRWLGFTVDTVPTGPGGEFYLFHWERPNV